MNIQDENFNDVLNVDSIWSNLLYRFKRFKGV